MKVVCIDNSGSGCTLIKYKIYDVLEERNGHYAIDDKSGNGWLKTRFKTLEDIRNEKLNLLIDDV